MYIYVSIFIWVLTSEIVRIAGKQMDLTRKVCPASCVDIPLMVPPTAQRWPQLGLSQKQGAEPADGPNPSGCRLKRTETAPGPMLLQLFFPSCATETSRVGPGVQNPHW